MFEAYIEASAGDIDTSDALNLLEIGLFDEVVYG